MKNKGPHFYGWAFRISLNWKCPIDQLDWPYKNKCLLLQRTELCVQINHNLLIRNHIMSYGWSYLANNTGSLILSLSFYMANHNQKLIRKLPTLTVNTGFNSKPAAIGFCDFLLNHPWFLLWQFWDIHSLLKEAQDNDLMVAPPQLYEVHRLASLADMNEVEEYTAQRESLGTERYFPIRIGCKDGAIIVSPGMHRATRSDFGNPGTLWSYLHHVAIPPTQTGILWQPEIHALFSEH